MDVMQALLVGGGAFLAGGMNAMAGGGTFFSFPALLAAGVPPVMANASNSVAMWPASLSSAWAYRREVSRHPRWTLLLVLLSFVGGIAGGLLLLATSNAAFARLVPWLLLVATGLFAFSGQVSRLVGAARSRLGLKRRADGTPGGVGGLLFQLCVAIYGGFFGAGMGILTLAALAIQGVDDIQELNGLKNLTSAVNYTVAAATFIVAGAISWPHTLLMIVTAMIGALAGSALARRLPALWLKRLVVAVGATLSVIYFFKTYS
ncbi:sulfite exporter TauE/SafE family protein [Zoogloea sp.]|uniref:sulfite exporter TauE/SafE family protein n=1 Tax=Zoogloea sp. TaxID=49181 RepID=UPI0035ADDAC0